MWTQPNQSDEIEIFSKIYLKQIIDFLPDATVVIDREGRVVAWNHAMERMTGVMAEDMVGKGNYEYAIPFYGERRPMLIDLVGKWDETVKQRYQYIRKEGEALVSETFDCLALPGGTLWNMASLLYDEKGEVIGAIESIRDISAHKNTERELKDRQAYFEGLVDNMPDAIAVFDDDGTITEINARFTRMFGFQEEEALGRDISGLVCPPDLLEEAREFKRRIASGECLSVETVRRHKEGRLVDVSLRSAPIIVDHRQIGHLAIYSDISARRQAEKEKSMMENQLLQARKIEAIGTLTAGIAHDYNNLLSVIMGNLSLAIEEAETDSLLSTLLNEADKAARKVRDLTYELMALSRGSVPVRRETRLSKLFEVIDLCIPPDGGVSVEKSIPKDLWTVRYDHSKMSDVLRNVVQNAVEAMPGGGGLLVRAKNLHVVEESGHGLLKPGRYIQISVEDQGRGISKEHLGRIFDPYFSTKNKGVQKGMGLGLATSYAIVQKHGGTMSINSSLGKGTAVNIYLPAEGPQAEMDEKGVPDLTTSVKRVLMMDDDEMMRRLAEKMLNRLGYAVETVKDGVEAVRAFERQQQRNEPFDAVILDLTIEGGMGGEQTIGELKKIDPQVRAIVSSGYFDDPVMKNFKKYGFKGAVPKPYEKRNFKEALERILD